MRQSDTDSSDDDDVRKIEERDQVKAVREKVPLVNIDTAGHNIVWQPDTAASRDIWSPEHLKHFEQLTKRTIKLTPSNVKLYAYGGREPLKLKGQFNTQLQVGDKMVQTNIIVTKDSSTYPLLSEQTARKLGVVSYNKRFMVNTVTPMTLSEITIEETVQGLRPSVKQIIHRYPNVFSGKIGMAKEPVKT